VADAAVRHITKDESEPIHMLTVYQAIATKLGGLLNNLGTLLYDNETNAYHVTISTPNGGYTIWSDDVRSFS
jgi:hypothetical protein